MMIFFHIAVEAQKTNLEILPCSGYTANPELDKFVGTWNWTDGYKSFTMTLKKEKVFDMMADDHSCKDILYGFHEYTQNASVVESSLSFQATTFYEGKKTIYMPGYIDKSNILHGGITNISRTNNRLNLKLQFMDSTHLKMKPYILYGGIRMYAPGQPIPTDVSINLPQDIILTKQ